MGRFLQNLIHWILSYLGAIGIGLIAGILFQASFHWDEFLHGGNAKVIELAPALSGFPVSWAAVAIVVAPFSVLLMGLPELIGIRSKFCIWPILGIAAVFAGDLVARSLYDDWFHYFDAIVLIRNTVVGGVAGLVLHILRRTSRFF